METALEAMAMQGTCLSTLEHAPHPYDMHTLHWHLRWESMAIQQLMILWLLIRLLFMASS